MHNLALVDDISRELMALRGSGRQTEPFSGRAPEFGLPMAYEVAARVRDLRRGAGESPIGRKIGFTNLALWQEKGISAPIWNYVFDGTVTEIGASEGLVDLRGMPEPRIEPEVVLHLSGRPEPGMTTSELLECIDWVAPGFEIVFSVFPAWAFAAADAVAAFGVHGALLVGAPLDVRSAGPRLLEDLSALGVVLTSDDGVRREGRGRDVLGGPVDALRFLVDELARSPGGEPLRPGEIVTTGTLTEAMPLRAGQGWSASFDGIDFSPVHLRAI